MFQSNSPTRRKISRFRGAEKSLFQSGSPTRWKIVPFRGAATNLFVVRQPHETEDFSFPGGCDKFAYSQAAPFEQQNPKKPAIMLK